MVMLQYLHMQWGRKQKGQIGFTIVELLIVIVVIGILAAITIVAFNGVQSRAKDSAAQSMASQVGKKVAEYAVMNADTYPADKASLLASTGVSETGGTTYDYIASPTQKAFCVTVTKQGVSYSFSSVSGAAVKGRCIENLAGNPNASGSSLWFFGAAGSTHAATNKAIATDRAHNGTSSLKATVTGTGQLSMMGRQMPNFRLNAGESLSWSYWVYSTKGGSAINILEGARVSDAGYTNTVIGITIPANTWTKISRTWAPSEDINVGQIGFYNLQVVSGDLAWFDELTIHKSDTLQQYADGDSSGGFWTGTTGASSSVNIVSAE